MEIKKGVLSAFEAVFADLGRKWPKKAFFGAYGP